MVGSPVRVAVVTTESYFSYSILADVLMDPGVECLAMIVLPGSGAASPLGTLRRVYRRSGPRLVGYKAATAAVASGRALAGRLGLVGEPATPTSLAERRRVPVHHVQDCNDSEVVNLIASLGIDILLSVNVYQRMLEPLLSSPGVGALNTHFGLLPHYRGMSPVLWAMANGERSIGITVHRMVLEFDEGRIVRQQVLDLEHGESVLRATVRGCRVARELLDDAVHELASNLDTGIPQQGAGSYYSLPTREAVAQLRRQGHALARVRDVRLLLE